VKTFEEALHSLFGNEQSPEQFLDKMKLRGGTMRDAVDNDRARLMVEGHSHMLMQRVVEEDDGGGSADERFERIESVICDHLLSLFVTGLLIGMEMEKQELGQPT